MRLYLLFIFLLLFVGFTSGVEQSLGTFKQSDCVELVQICSNCSYNNITSLLFPNSTIALQDAIMSKRDSFYNYTFCNTSTLGNYIVNGIGDLNGADTVWVYDFNITPAGWELDISQAFLYMFMLIILIFAFLLSTWGAVKLRWKNERNSYDEIIKVNWRKYLKMFSAGMSYMLLVWIMFLGWNLSWGYLHMRGLSEWFRYSFNILVGLALPVFAGMVILFTITFINDQRIQNFINKEFPVT